MTMPPKIDPHDETSSERADALFRAMVDSVGVKRFSSALGLSVRQVNRMLSGAQPNPLERLMVCLQSCTPETGDRALDFLCHEMGGSFVRHTADLDDASVNAVRECAEAIAAISDGHITPCDREQVREAIAALIALSRMVSRAK